MADSIDDSSMKPKLGASLVATFLPVVLLLPFINKAFHIDDTVYVLVAQRIVENPFDYFGFQMNWTGKIEWVYEFNKNPPGLSYYLAPWGLVFGWSEVSMHMAMLVPTAIASLGIFRMAERLCERPLLATALSICTPVFLVSSSNVMCEPLMLACYVWAIVCWLHGMDTSSKKMMLIAAVLIGVGTLVKFVTFTAVPLLVAYTIMRDRKLSSKLFWFLIPLFMLLAYDATSWLLYDKSFLRDIARFSLFHTSLESRSSTLAMSLVTLAYVGGLILPTAFSVLWAESRKIHLLFLGTIALTLGYMFINGGIDESYGMYGVNGLLWGLVSQQVLFTAIGAYSLLLAGLAFHKSRDENALLLLLLVLGIFVFGGFVNWTLNARALLPMVPAVAILAVRRLDAIATSQLGRPAQVAFCLGASAYSILVCIGDYQFAGTAREFVNDVRGDLDSVDGTVWYDGHLGFQYYMHEAGYKALDFTPGTGDLAPEDMFRSAELILEQTAPGDMLITWQNLALMKAPPRAHVASQKELFYSGATWISIYDSEQRTGFYGNPKLLLPYRFGNAPSQEFRLYELK